MAVCFDGRVLGIRYQAVCCLQKLVWCGVGVNNCTDCLIVESSSSSANKVGRALAVVISCNRRGRIRQPQEGARSRSSLYDALLQSLYDFAVDSYFSR